jgi:hypothetical protein
MIGLVYEGCKIENKPLTFENETIIKAIMTSNNCSEKIQAKGRPKLKL